MFHHCISRNDLKIPQSSQLTFGLLNKILSEMLYVLNTHFYFKMTLNHIFLRAGLINMKARQEQNNIFKIAFQNRNTYSSDAVF